MRQSPATSPRRASPWRRFSLAVRRLMTRPPVEAAHILDLDAGLAMPDRTVREPPSRFAPDPGTLPPIASPTVNPATVVTSIPAFAKPVSSRRSVETARQPIDSSTSPRQASRSKSSRQTGPTKVTVGDSSDVTGNTASVLRERVARESYELKSRELERAADERLVWEQQLVERRIREQLAARQRELDSTLEVILEDTIILPRSIETD